MKIIFCSEGKLAHELKIDFEYTTPDWTLLESYNSFHRKHHFFTAAFYWYISNLTTIFSPKKSPEGINKRHALHHDIFFQFIFSLIINENVFSLYVLPRQGPFFLKVLILQQITPSK